MFGFYKTQHYNNTFNFQSVFFKKWKCTISEIKSVWYSSYCSSTQLKMSHYCKLFRSKLFCD
jgi:2-oxoglutarate dehydrogenase complex dehydrogenase (E1) component-like enzyme